jgi:hypothetical protein
MEGQHIHHVMMMMMKKKFDWGTRVCVTSEKSGKIKNKMDTYFHIPSWYSFFFWTVSLFPHLHCLFFQSSVASEVSTTFKKKEKKKRKKKWHWPALETEDSQEAPVHWLQM